MQSDPLGAFNFEVTIGTETIGFCEVVGLGVEVDASGRASEVGFRRGVTGDHAIWSWVSNTLAGTDDRRRITITLRTAQGEPACSWVLTGARLVRWNGPHLDANTAAPAIEEIVVAPAGIEFHAHDR